MGVVNPERKTENESRASGTLTINKAGLCLTGSRVVIRGGNANNAANDGAAYVNVNNDLGNANANYGGRLATSVETLLSGDRLVTLRGKLRKAPSTDCKAPVGERETFIRPCRAIDTTRNIP